MKTHVAISKGRHLGDYILHPVRFEGLGVIEEEFRSKDFRGMSERVRSERVNRILLDLIDREKEPCFLLVAVLEYIDLVCREKVLEQYTFSNFEL